MVIKILNILLGIGFIAAGVIMIVHEWEFHYGFPVPKSTGWLVMGFGSLLLLVEIFKKSIKREKYKICNVCKKIYYSNEITGDKCDVCQGDLESLKGFYERHPDLK